MGNFSLSLCRLFQNYPLVKYRTSVSDDRYELNVILIGSGSRMDTILQELLINGQILDTDLKVTAFTPNAARSSKSLTVKAPELIKYVHISCNGTEVNAPADEDVYAWIHYRSISKDNESFLQDISGVRASGSNYVIISTGNDSQNYAYAQMMSALFGKGSVISFVQNRRPAEEINAESDIFAFGFQKDTAYLEQLESIAYNLHYAYCKSANDRASNSQIRAAFNDPYNYVSNLKAAMHIQVKLACCGIDTSDNHMAAEAFSELMTEDPSIVNRLAALEHRRWMMEKMLNGFTQAESLNMIYCGNGITTHDSAQKWHTCLVPCNETSQLISTDWKDPFNPREELDPLDRISLRIHAKCGQIAVGNRELIEDTLSVIKNTALRFFKGHKAVLPAVYSMELAISQMWQNKRSALSIYEGNYRTIADTISSVSKPMAAHLMQSLSLLNDALAPLKEFVSFKDYKEQDRLLIRQIPFALTHKKQPVLIRLLSDNNMDSVYTACRLEPDRVIFVDIVASHNDYLKFREHASIISRFLKQSFPDILQKYQVILPEKLADEYSKKIRSVTSQSIKIHTTDRISYQNVSGILYEIARESGADYIDVTKGNPLLIMCAANAGTSVIAQSPGSMTDILNAPEVRYPSPEKAITVKEMFDLSGTVLVKERDASVLSDLSGKYKKIYKASIDASNWDDFCQFIYVNKQNIVKFPAVRETDKIVKKSITLNTDTANALLPALLELEKTGYLSGIFVASDLSGQRSISFKIAGDSAGDMVSERIHQCADNYTPSTSYKLGIKEKRYAVIGSDLLVKGLKLPAEKKEEYRDILNTLAANNLLLDYAVDNTNKNDPKFSFQFASRDVLRVFEKGGNALEYYIYYSALLDAHFNDVEMGWKFYHSVEEDSAQNELDIICTKGISSLFISAKTVSKNHVSSDREYLKYIIYEISLEAERFGINAKAALAMPEVDQFKFNKQKQEWEFSSEVKNAYSRGVYLIGKECFKDDALGEVLDRIADGREDWCDFLKPQA